MAQISPSHEDRRLLIFGIVNVTPDSFSDGGSCFKPRDALEQAEKLWDAGADVIDIGAESTRPGAKAVDAAEEWQRLSPVLEGLAQRNLLSKVSVDTRSADVMHKTSAMGVGWINCVGPLPSESVLRSMVQENPSIGFVATHMHGTPQDMQLNPLSASKVTSRVEQFFESSEMELREAGFKADRVLYDPGIGFGKSDAANISLLRQCGVWSQSLPVAVGVSRKGIFSRLFGVSEVKARDPVSKVAELTLAMLGVQMIRTHDVSGLVHCLKAAGIH